MKKLLFIEWKNEEKRGKANKFTNNFNLQSNTHSSSRERGENEFEMN